MLYFRSNQNTLCNDIVLFWRLALGGARRPQSLYWFVPQEVGLSLCSNCFFETFDLWPLASQTGTNKRSSTIRYSMCKWSCNVCRHPVGSKAWGQMSDRELTLDGTGWMACWDTEVQGNLSLSHHKCNLFNSEIIRKGKKKLKCHDILAGGKILSCPVLFSVLEGVLRHYCWAKWN